MIEEVLTQARAELAELDARRDELLREISQAEAILGAGRSVRHSSLTSGDAAPAVMTLHEALARVLENRGNEWMTGRELADEVNRRGLYRKRDGSPVEVNQVHARTSNYEQLFEKSHSGIRLKRGATVIAPETPNLVMFKDDDEGFFAWQESNTDGEFINTERKPNPNYLVLHKSGCPHFKDQQPVHWTKDYVKLCSCDRATLERWARDTVGGEVTLCRTCFDS